MADTPAKKDPNADLPPISVQDTVLKHTGALCPADNTLVTCSGPRDDAWISGQCSLCGRLVYARADLVSSTGTFEVPSAAPVQAAVAVTTKTCPECLSDIPLEAKRCKFCGQAMPSKWFEPEGGVSRPATTT